MDRWRDLFVWLLFTLRNFGGGGSICGVHISEMIRDPPQALICPLRPRSQRGSRARFNQTKQEILNIIGRNTGIKFARNTEIYIHTIRIRNTEATNKTNTDQI